MSSTSQVPAFLKANETYVTQFDKGGLPMPPARKVAIVTCMDARIDPAKILGLEIGDVRVFKRYTHLCLSDFLCSYRHM
jgi:carbonic anhydrase